MTVVDGMQQLMAIERANVILMEQLAFFAQDKNANRLLATIRHNAAVSCEGLHSLIMERGETVTNDIADLQDQVMDLPSWHAQFEYLLQEEMKVVRLIEELPAEEMSPGETTFLHNLRETHLGNIQKYRILLG